MAGLFRTPAPPAVMAAAPMPDPNSAAVLEAQKQQVATSLSRAGRASTIMGTQSKGGQSAAPVATAASSPDNYTGGSLGGSK